MKVDVGLFYFCKYIIYLLIGIRVKARVKRYSV